MTKSLKTVIEDVAESLGWTCRFGKQKSKRYISGKWDKEVTEKYVEFSQYSPAGEDFSFCIFYYRLSNIPMKIYDEYEEFDIDDHVRMWLEAKANGMRDVPNARVLVKDAEDIEQMILDLAAAIRDAFRHRGI